jgi:hypothetical protein
MKGYNRLIISIMLYCFISVNAKAQDKGFIKLFDGKTLKGWKGDPEHWKVENGLLIGEVTPQKQLKENTFLIWQGGEVADFELKIQYKISEGGNSGVQYRSEMVAGLPYAMKGYQADIDGKNEYTGLNYEERGRGFIARRGEKVVVDSSGKPLMEQSLGSSDSLAKSLKLNNWNEYHLIVLGNRMQHFINGVLMSDAIDNDETHRKSSGLLGLQAHVTPEMRVEFRNIRLKKLK